ncbi:MAG: DUF1702 family protein [Myxococcota bacterium]
MSGAISALRRFIPRPEPRGGGSDRFAVAREAFAAGFHRALDDRASASVTAALETFDPPRRGFAWEGAGLALQLADRWAPGPGNAVREVRDLVPRPYLPFLAVGVGWAWARGARLSVEGGETALAAFDRGTKDGLGFHEGYFAAYRFRKALFPPRGEDVDHGLGRSAWFVFRGDARQVMAALARFPEPRRDALWKGVGFAATYCGGADARALVSESGAWAESVASGARRAQAMAAACGYLSPRMSAAAEALAGPEVSAGSTGGQQMGGSSGSYGLRESPPANSAHRG